MLRYALFRLPERLVEVAVAVRTRATRELGKLGLERPGGLALAGDFGERAFQPGDDCAGFCQGVFA
jgi:hypothetical protein